MYCFVSALFCACDPFVGFAEVVLIPFAFSDLSFEIHVGLYKPVSFFTSLGFRMILFDFFALVGALVRLSPGVGDHRSGAKRARL